MSFLNHIGLGWMDPTNELDKLGNAIKGGDLSALIKHLKSLFRDVEDRLAEVSELFEDSMEDAKKDMRHEMSRAKRKIVREARRDLELLQEEFGGKLTDAMRPVLEEVVEAEFSRRFPDAQTD